MSNSNTLPVTALPGSPALPDQTAAAHQSHTRPERTNPSRRYRVKLLSLSVIRPDGAPDPRILADPSAAAALARDLIQDDDQEHFLALYLNASNRLLSAHHLATGTLTAALVSPRELLRGALLAGAAAMILTHNHPSGDPTPSREDIRLTRQLAKAARLLEIKVHDHVILGNGTGRWASLAQQGIV